MSLKTRNFAPVIELGRHIEILLLSNDCVIVPELGGFMAHHIPAHYDHDDKLFLPPLRTLGFNPQLKLNDSLLAQSYIEAYDISYPEAIRRIEEEVNELKQRLNNEGSYELNDIGILRLNENGIYVFEPCEAGILTPELYGLSSFELRQFSDNTTEIVSVAARNNDNDVAANQNKEAESATIDNYSDEERTIKIKVAWIRNAVSIAAAIIAFFFITSPISNSDMNSLPTDGAQTANILSISNGKQENAYSLDTTGMRQVIAARHDSTKLVSVKKDTPVVKKSDSIPALKAKGYCIVLASHVTKKNAETFVKELQSKGFEEAYTYINNNIVRVVYGNYDDESEAHKALQNVRGSKYFEQSWIYKKK